MFRIKIISFIAYEDRENTVNDIKEQIEYLIADTPHKEEKVIAKIEDEEKAKEIFTQEKQKIAITQYSSTEECYIGEELVLTEIEEDGIFKGLDYPDPIETYIKFE